MKMKKYTVLTLEDLIEQLHGIADGPVEGLDGFIHSDRSYYDRNATAPGGPRTTGTELADRYSSEIGAIMTGWKGGEYPIRDDMPVTYAFYGDIGPYIAAVEQYPDGIYRPVLVDARYW